MPPKLPPISGEEAVRVLKRLGFVPIRQRGSHLVLKKQMPEGELGCVVPLHKELALGTLRSVLRQAGVTPEEFVKHL